MELLNDFWIVWGAWTFICLGMGLWVGIKVGRANPKSLNAGLLPNGTTIIIDAASVWTVKQGALEEMK